MIYFNNYYCKYSTKPLKKTQRKWWPTLFNNLYEYPLNMFDFGLSYILTSWYIICAMSDNKHNVCSALTAHVHVDITQKCLCIMHWIFKSVRMIIFWWKKQIFFFTYFCSINKLWVQIKTNSMRPLMSTHNLFFEQN